MHGFVKITEKGYSLNGGLLENVIFSPWITMKFHR